MATGNFEWDRVFRFSQLCLFIFFGGGEDFFLPGIHVFCWVFLSDQFSLFMYLCLLPSSATVKMDNGENMEDARYAMNDDTAGFISQMKNRNTSRKTEYDLKLMKTNYFTSIYT